MTTILELIPNRSLLDVEFDGYKLSLENIPSLSYDLDKPVYKAQPNAYQLSLLYMRFFGLHNHLHSESIQDTDLVYIIDVDMNIKRFNIDTHINRFITANVWNVPCGNLRETGDYNITLKLLTENLATVSDGLGNLYILETGFRLENISWQCCFSDEILGPNKKFIIQDAICKINDAKRRELHCLLLSLCPNNDKMSTVLYVVVLVEHWDRTWGQISIKELSGEGPIYYSYFEKSCEALYVASNDGFKFTIDSDNPVTGCDPIDAKQSTLCIWAQTNNDITFKIISSNEFIGEQISVRTSLNEITVKDDECVLLSRNLCRDIKPNLTTWNVCGTILEIVLVKEESNVMWPNITDNDNDKYIVDGNVTEEINERLTPFWNKNEVLYLHWIK